MKRACTINLNTDYDFKCEFPRRIGASYPAIKKQIIIG
jgi:hypothetical protein